MKIGTLSHNINAPDFNYGAILHSWAFQQYLINYKHLDAESINYTIPKVEGWNRYNPQKSAANYGHNRYVGVNMDDYLSRAHKFDAFIENHLKVSDERYVQKTLANAELPYDTVICESDVIWDTSRGKFDPVYFLATPSMRGKRRIAYSPSMADMRYNETREAQLDPLLEGVHFVSCRESYQVELLERHTNKPVQQVVDPVMLVDASDYEAITGPRLVPEKYILLYLPVDNNEKLREQAMEFAKEKGYRVVEISTLLRRVDDEEEFCIPDAGVEEFLSGIKNAEVVFTNSFHAICFAIIFGTQFYAFTRKFNGKVKDICDWFGLDDYYLINDTFEEKEPYDVAAVQAQYLELQKEGREWLDNALTAETEGDLDTYDPKLIETYYDNTNNAYRRYLKMRKSAKNTKKKVRSAGGKVKRKAKAVKGKTKKRLRSVRRAAWTLRDNALRDKTEIVDNKIAVMTITDTYNCNPKYICDEIIRRGLPYDIVWIVGKNADVSKFPPEVRVVRKNTKEAALEAYSAKIWLNNGICFSEYYDKKPGQAYIQTMHGSLGIKRLVNSIPSRMKTMHGRLVVERECNNTDCVLTNSQFEEDVFRSTFWENTPMLRIGHARTDVLFDTDPELVAEIRKRLWDEYSIPTNKKLALYAPTHRKGLTFKDLAIDYAAFTDALTEKFTGEYAVMVKLHPKTKKVFANNNKIQDVLGTVLFDVTDYPDIQELMIVTDVAITDYSSWIYDYIYTRRPGFLFATDLDKYNDITGLMYPMETTPFPVSDSSDALIATVEDFDEELFDKRIDEFLLDKEAMDDGCGAERAVDFIASIIEDCDE